MSTAPTQPATRPETQQHQHAPHCAMGSADSASPHSESQSEGALPFSTPDFIQLLAALDFDPIALAAHLDLHLLDILAWYESPEVQDIITRYEAFEDRMLELRAKRSKRTAIDTLETVIKSAEDLPERRRAATTLLRALTRPLPRPKRNTEQSDTDALLNDSIRAASQAVTQSTPPAEPRSESDLKATSASDHGDDNRDVDPNDSISNAHHDDHPEPRSRTDRGTPEARHAPFEKSRPGSRVPIAVQASRPAQTGAHHTKDDSTRSSRRSDVPEPLTLNPHLLL